jgi:hypothetical protein
MQAQNPCVGRSFSPHSRASGPLIIFGLQRETYVMTWSVQVLACSEVPPPAQNCTRSKRVGGEPESFLRIGRVTDEQSRQITGAGSDTQFLWYIVRTVRALRRSVVGAGVYCHIISRCGNSGSHRGHCHSPITNEQLLERMTKFMTEHSPKH